MESGVKTVVFWAFVLVCLMLLWGVVGKGANAGKTTELAYSDLFDRVQSGQVLDATIEGEELRGHLKSSPKNEFRTTLPANYDDLEKAMLAARVNFTVKEPRNHGLSPLFLNAGPIAIFLLCTLAALPPFWMIFKKAGFQPFLSILVLVPLANLITLYVVAFSRWKAEPGRPA